MKILKTIMIAALLVVPVQLKAQAPAELRQIAESSYRDKDYEKSTDNFLRLIASGQARAGDIYNGACSAALAGRTEEAFNLLEEAIKKGFDSWDHILKGDRDLVTLRAQPRWKEIEQLINEKRTAVEKLMASLPQPIDAFNKLRENGYVKTLITLERMLTEHPEGPAQWKDLLTEVVGWTRALVGDVRGALAAFDGQRTASRSKLPADFASYTAVSATEAIAAEAQKTRIVVINEGHHVPMHRVLTRELLKTLYAQGYRYFAVEALGHDETVNSTNFPLMVSSYTADPVFADLLRTAVKQGYTLISYDTFPPTCQATAEDPNACFNARDSMAANNIMKRVFEKDPNAKLLAHVGYSHAIDNRAVAMRAKALAWQLMQRTGVDPVTVDQTQMMERTDTMLEDPEYRDVMRRGIAKGPLVLRKPDGSYYRSSSDGFGGVDMQVFSSRTQYVDGRPSWLTRLDRSFVKTNVKIPQDGKTYLVQAYAQDQLETSVPVDQALAAGKSPTLALPQGKFIIVVSGENGEVSRTTLVK